MIIFYVHKNYDQIKCILILNYIKLYKARRAAWGVGGCVVILHNFMGSVFNCIACYILGLHNNIIIHGSTWYCIVLYIYFPETVQTHVI